MQTVTAAMNPLDALRCQPVDQPMVLLHSAHTESQWSQRSITATPQTYLTIDERGARWEYGPGLFDADERDADPLTVLQRAIACTRNVPGLWIGYLSYELGRTIEPIAQAVAGKRTACDDRFWPVLEFAWCPHATWLQGTGERVCRSVERHGGSRASTGAYSARDSAIGELQPALSKEEYCDRVAYVIEAIAAGDIFQANFTHRFTATMSGSSRELARQALQQSAPWFGAYLELPGGRSLCSLSPELFLQYDAATRMVTTRPIKGTRPSHSDPAELLHSDKDIAELTMIIDLMRNDLGRVCEFGSVRVPHHRVIETHAGVHHGVGEVVGRVREQCSVTDLLRATMPAGSITGAPKIRAMQIIDELESTRRGPYCGAIGVIDPAGNATFNVAIRTMSLTGMRVPGRCDAYEHALLDYGAGGGIVADSIPEAEYQEMLDKTAVLREVISQSRRDAGFVPARV